MALAGSVVVVTGAGSAIGRAIVSRFSAAGAQLILADIDESSLNQSLRDLAPGAMTFVGDLSSELEARRLANEALAAFGRIDVLVNNAGGGIIAPFLQHTPETMQATIARNLWTCVWCCYAVLPSMRAQNYGRIINIGADSVRNGLWDHAMYNAAKGGVHALATGLAREFAQQDITINTVAPCMIRTPLVELATAQKNPLIEKYLSVIPKGRPGEPLEVASMVAHLALPESGFITGQVISVNGGSTML